ncbi:MAG: hypothetical protein ACR2MP_18830 [Streptosporangiaceae bacterium]
MSPLTVTDGCDPARTDRARAEGEQPGATGEPPGAGGWAGRMGRVSDAEIVPDPDDSAVWGAQQSTGS